jgi:mono/diheme cytochrome c family protein
MQKCRTFKILAIAMGLAVNLAGFNAPSHAENASAGRLDYQATCAACHGKTGKGDGPLVPDLKTQPPDLTMLAKNNDGVFPAEVLYRIIDGRKTIRAHGTYDMPVWGSLFQRSGTEDAVKQRISGLIDYLKSIQVK